jgi:polyhydroxybutyrate depolymerase
MSIMANRRSVLVVILALINLPIALAAIEAISFYADQANSGAVATPRGPREYLLYVPPGYDPSKATPLVISMHGAMMWPAQQRDMTGWNRLADEHGFIVLYPSGEGGRVRVFELGPADLKATMQYVADLIDTVRSKYNIDADRIYADGLSNGAGTAFAVSCTLADRIAAIGMVSSALLLPFEWCPDRRPIPLMAFHGTADTATPYGGGKSWVVPFPLPSVPQFVADWSARNQCRGQPVDARVAPRVSRRSYSGCAGNADVVLYTIDGGGHTWPGGGTLPEWFVGSINRNVNATRELWSFYQAHPRQLRFQRVP